MPAPRVWTPEDDALIVAMRAAGKTWDQIGAHFGRHRTQITDHAKVVGIWRPEAVEPQPEPAAGRSDMWPLPAGHPQTWGAITKGTVLEGMKYPR